jgi:hypothetical protein
MQPTPGTIPAMSIMHRTPGVRNCIGSMVFVFLMQGSSRNKFDLPASWCKPGSAYRQGDRFSRSDIGYYRRYKLLSWVSRVERIINGVTMIRRRQSCDSSRNGWIVDDALVY